MLTVADGRQQGFFDAAWCGDVVDPAFFCGLLAEHGHRKVREHEVRPALGRAIDAPLAAMGVRAPADGGCRAGRPGGELELPFALSPLPRPDVVPNGVGRWPRRR